MLPCVQNLLHLRNPLFSSLFRTSTSRLLTSTRHTPHVILRLFPNMSIPIKTLYFRKVCIYSILSTFYFWLGYFSQYNYFTTYYGKIHQKQILWLQHFPVKEKKTKSSIFLKSALLYYPYKSKNDNWHSLHDLIFRSFITSSCPISPKRSGDSGLCICVFLITILLL